MKDKIKIDKMLMNGREFELMPGMPKMFNGLRLRSPNEIIPGEEGNQSAPDSPSMVNKINSIAWQALANNSNVEGDRKVEMEVFQSPFFTKE